METTVGIIPAPPDASEGTLGLAELLVGGGVRDPGGARPHEDRPGSAQASVAGKVSPTDYLRRKFRKNETPTFPRVKCPPREQKRRTTAHKEEWASRPRKAELSEQERLGERIEGDWPRPSDGGRGNMPPGDR